MRVGKPQGPQGPAETNGTEKAAEVQKPNAAAKPETLAEKALKQPDLPKTQIAAQQEPVQIAPAELQALAARLQAVNLGAKGAVDAAPPLTLTIEQSAQSLETLQPPLSGGDVIGLRFAGTLEAPPKLEGAVRELARLADALLTSSAGKAEQKGDAAAIGAFLKEALPDLKTLGNKELAKLAHALEAKQLGNAKQVLAQLQKIFGPISPEMQRALSRLSPSTVLLLSSLAKKLEKGTETKKPDAKTPAAPKEDEVELSTLQQAIATMPPLTLPRYDELTVMSSERRAAFGGLIDKMLASMSDPVQCAELVLLQIRADNQEDLKGALAEMQEINKKKQAQREFLTQMKQQRAQAETMLRQRYDERVKSGEIDPTVFSFEDFEASQQLMVGSSDGSVLPDGDASETDAQFTFDLGPDVAAPPPNTSGETSASAGAASDPAQTNAATVDVTLLLPPGNTPEQFAAKLNISVDDLKQLAALYNSFPSYALRGRMGMGGVDDDHRPDFVAFLTHFNCVDLKAPSDASQSAKVATAVTTLKKALTEAISAHEAAEQRRAARDAETQALMSKFALSADDVQFCRLRYGRVKDKYPSLEAFLIGELKLSKADPGRNAAIVDALRPKTTDMTALAAFAEQFGLSKGAALAAWDMFCARGDRSKTDFGAIPSELFAYLQSECGFDEFSPAGNEKKVSDWIVARAAGQDRLNGSAAYDQFLKDITDVGIGEDGTVLSASNGDYRSEADAVDRAMKSHYDGVLGQDRRKAIDEKLFAYFRAMMFESYYTTVEGEKNGVHNNEERRAYFSPSAAYDALVSYVQGHGKKADCADYIELRILEFQRDLIASSSGGVRENLGDSIGDVLNEFGKGFAAGASASSAALVPTIGGIALIPAVAPVAGIVVGTLFAVDGDKISGNFWSSFIPENEFGNSGTKGWKLEDDREEQRYKDAHDGEGHGGMWVENETRDSARGKAVEWMMGKGDTGFGSTYKVKVDKEGKPYIEVGFAMDARVPNEHGYPTTKFRNDCFEGDDETMAKARQDRVALDYVTALDKGEAYGDAAMRRGMGEADTELDKGLSREEKISQLEAELADARRRNLGEDAIRSIERKLAIERAKQKAKAMLEEKIEERRAQGHDSSARSFLTASSSTSAAAPAEEDGASVGGQRMTIAELDAQIEGWQNQLDSMSESSEAMQLRLQILMDRFQQCAQMLSNIMKKASDTSGTLINNVK